MLSLTCSVAIGGRNILGKVDFIDKDQKEQ